MQMRAFRGSRTVMSLRLCSRAPWTTSSSAAIEEVIVPRERTFVKPSRCNERRSGNGGAMGQTARKAAVATLVAGSIIVLGLALWKMRLVLALLFSALIIAAAIRPGIDWLARRRVPPAVLRGGHRAGDGWARGPRRAPRRRPDDPLRGDARRARARAVVRGAAG